MMVRENMLTSVLQRRVADDWKADVTMCRSVRPLQEKLYGLRRHTLQHALKSLFPSAMNKFLCRSYIEASGVMQ